MEVTTWDTKCSGKEQALKVLEEAAEVFSAVENLEASPLPVDRIFLIALADEIADVLTAICNLARKYRIDVPAALIRCEQRNHKRGRC